HGDTRIIRHAYGEGEEYVSFALKAQQLWHELEEASGKQLFLQTGVLNMGHGMTNFTQNIIASSKTYSLPLEVLHAKEVNTRWPGITLRGDYIGCFEQMSGVVNSEACIEAYRKLGVLHGATILSQGRVENVCVHKEIVRVETDSQTL